MTYLELVEELRKKGDVILQNKHLRCDLTHFLNQCEDMYHYRIKKYGKRKFVNRCLEANKWLMLQMLQKEFEIIEK